MGYVMRVFISGTRDGVDWPAVGEPAPNLPKAELAELAEAGIIVEQAVAPKPEAAELPDPEAPTPLKPESRKR